jgi:hypothetical protein
LDFWVFTDRFLDNPALFAWILGISVLLFYFCNTLVWWLYGLKQWIISIEIPRKLNSEPKEKTCVTKKFYR